MALDINTGKLVWYYQYLPNNSWDYDEVGIHMLYDVTINGETRKAVAHFGRNGFYYTLDRNNGSFIKGGQYVNELNWTKGLDPKTGKPVEYDPSLDVQNTSRRRGRCGRTATMMRVCPTWHGGVAHQPTAYNPAKHIAYGVGAEGCFTETGEMAPFKGPRRPRQGQVHEAQLHERPLLRRHHRLSMSSTGSIVAKAVSDIENRSGAIVTAGGVVFTALQDGWIIAYNDETLEELWRFNVGTPLKGAP